MYILVGFSVFALGAIIGSFLNVVINRYHTGKTFFGRSMCPVCGKTLRWYELIPIVSFLIQMGRCRECGCQMSLQYLFVEIMTGALFLGVFLLPEWQIVFQYKLLLPPTLIWETLLLWVTLSILVVIFVYDWKHKIIPNPCVYGFIALSFLLLIYNAGGISNLSSGIFIWDLWAGPALAVPLFLIWFFSKGRLMGLGDAKLALGLGWFLGFVKGVTAFVLSFWIGAIVGIFLLLLKRKTLTMKSEIPFGPFLILGALLAFFFNLDILSFLLLS